MIVIYTPIMAGVMFMIASKDLGKAEHSRTEQRNPDEKRGICYRV